MKVVVKVMVGVAEGVKVNIGICDGAKVGIDVFVLIIGGTGIGRSGWRGKKKIKYPGDK